MYRNKHFAVFITVDFEKFSIPFDVACNILFEAESNSELTVFVPAYQLHFRFPVQNKIHKPKILSNTRTGILGSIAGPCDFYIKMLLILFVCPQ
jgi:hypothetical protein